MRHGNFDFWYIDLPYFIGSVSFMFGGLFSLWMWKSEHYGLGLISDINVSRPDAGVNVEELKR